MSERQPYTPPEEEQNEMERAIVNFEKHWRNCVPMVEVRAREGLPIVTKEELRKELEEERDRFRAKIP